MKSSGLIFLFSLPRSGSTLLQRILSRHEKIATVSEPWLLLPLLYCRKHYGVYTEYNHGWAQSALQDFIAQLPNQQQDYRTAVRDFASTLYRLSTPSGAAYFIDKTPRYYLIIPQIAEIFPDAKYIFLFRNPLQVLSSIVQSACNNRLLYHEYFVDLYLGPRLLAEGYTALQGRSLYVSFDALATEPANVVNQIFDYLELPHDPTAVDYFRENVLSGRMGDKTGVYQYNRVESKVTEKWRGFLTNSFRKHLAKKYINALNSEHLMTFGHQKAEIIRAIDSQKVNETGIFTDIFYYILTHVYRCLEIPLFVKKLRSRQIHKNGEFLLHR